MDASLPPDGITPAAEQAHHEADAFPYDGAVPVDTAHRAAQGILAALCGRCGVGDELDDLDDDVKAEIAAVLAQIIRLSMAGTSPAAQQGRELAPSARTTQESR